MLKGQTFMFSDETVGLQFPQCLHPYGRVDLYYSRHVIPLAIEGFSLIDHGTSSKIQYFLEQT